MKISVLPKLWLILWRLVLFVGDGLTMTIGSYGPYYLLNVLSVSLSNFWNRSNDLFGSCVVVKIVLPLWTSLWYLGLRINVSL